MNSHKRWRNAILDPEQQFALPVKNCCHAEIGLVPAT